MSVDGMFQILMENLDVGEDVISCMTSVNGYNEETAEDILYWASGYHTFEQMYDELGYNDEGY